MAVEKICAHCALQAHLALRYDDGHECRADSVAQRGENGILFRVRALVTKETVAIADGYHVVVKYAGINRIRVLLGQQHASGARP